MRSGQNLKIKILLFCTCDEPKYKYRRSGIRQYRRGVIFFNAEEENSQRKHSRKKGKSKS